MKIKDLGVAIVRWFDTSIAPTTAPEEEDGKDKLDLVRSIPFLAMHVMCLGVFLVGFSWTAVIVCLAFYALRMFAITGFYHRYFSHRSFEMNRFWQFVFAVIGNSSAQRGPLWWAAHHRNHHTHSDEEDDVHSPHHHSLYWSHMGWVSSKRNFATDMRRVQDLAKFPELRFLDRFDIIVPILAGVFMFFFGVALQNFAPGLGVTGMSMLIWGFFVSTVFLFHATCTINSLSHVFGSRRYETTDKSRNNFWLALLTFGEGWHNNHHHYPLSTRQGFRWYEIDLTYYTIKVLSWVRIVKNIKPVPEKYLNPASENVA